MKNKLDLKKIAASVQDYILSLPCTSDLPRKFKISFSACQTACAKPWLNDLGFIAMPQNRFKVIAAGSMGPKPSLGIELFDDLAIQDILPLAQASVEFFHLHGDRQDRRKARFRHIREKLGDEVFKEQLKERFEKIKKEKTCPKIKPLESDQILTLKYKLNLPNGNISPDDALLLADSAQPFLAQLRINLTHGLEIFADNSFELPHHLAKLADNPVITACPGCSTCPNGIVDCYETADLIRRSLTGSDYSALSINISGCPNNCAHSAAASIGLIGAKKTFGDVTYSAYRIMLGGGNGKNNKLAQFSRTLKSQDISNYINNNFT